MKLILLIILLISCSFFIYSDETVITKDGKKVLLKSNGTWEYIIDENTEIKYADDAVIIWDTTFERGEVNYSNAVKLFLHYQNLTSKKIIGVSVHIEIKNSFDEIVLNRTINDEVLLKPNQRLKNNTYWYWDDNQFINDEPYDKMWKLADNGTAKIKTKILKVIFDDGTILTPAE